MPILDGFQTFSKLVFKSSEPQPGGLARRLQGDKNASRKSQVGLDHTSLQASFTPSLAATSLLSSHFIDT